MSGTAYGTVVLHTAPEAAAGGPLALVQNGDMIELDVAKRRLHLHVSDAELAAPRGVEAAARRTLTAATGKLYFDHVLQADRGRRPRLPGRQARRLRAARQPLTSRSTALRSQGNAYKAR